MNAVETSHLLPCAAHEPDQARLSSAHDLGASSEVHSCYPAEALTTKCPPDHSKPMDSLLAESVKLSEAKAEATLELSYLKL